MAAHSFTLDGFDTMKSEKGDWVGLPYIKKQPSSGASPTALTIGT